VTGLLILAAITFQSSDTGAVLYRSWCAACHGRDARGTPSASVRTSVPPAGLADCSASTPEPEARWLGVVTRGGAAYGLSLDMPAFGGAVSPEQIRWVVRYIRSLCGNPAWPPGELNFPRAYLAEKAFPENEVVVVNHGREQEYIYERRMGPRFQIELAGRTAFDGARNSFGGVGFAGKYDLWHSPGARVITSAGIEAIPPLGRQDRWEVEPFVSFGWSPHRAMTLQGEVVATWEEQAGITGAEYRLGLGKQLGRVVPMVEAGWVVPRQGERTLLLYPQLWVQLSRLGHVAGSLGAEVGPAPRRPTLIAFLLWDYGDSGLLRGW
jgi:mono/diheme cytochrome c family protein